MRLLPLIRPFITPLVLPIDDPRAHGRGATAESLGPELAPSLVGGPWIAGGTGASYDSVGGRAVFSASSSTAACEVTSIAALDDNTTYKVVFTISNYVQGSCRIQVSGDTANHLGTAGPVTSAGTHTFYITTNSTTSNTNRIRIQSNGPSSPGNTFDVTSISVKKVN